MGGVVYQSYQQLRDDLLASGHTIDAEAVQYPAAPVPLKGGVGGWLDFLGSVDDGTDAVAKQFTAFTERCPDTKVVLAGYSQGAMVIHRNLYDLADDPHVAAALLIGDGDRLPADTTIALGSAAGTADRGKGVAQEHSFLASPNTFATARDHHSAVAANGYLYIIGGRTAGGDTNDIQVAKINAVTSTQKSGQSAFSRK